MTLQVDDPLCDLGLGFNSLGFKEGWARWISAQVKGVFYWDQHVNILTR